MTLWMPNKKRPLYAPMLGSLGGGSARGFGRGLGGDSGPFYTDHGSGLPSWNLNGGTDLYIDNNAASYSAGVDTFGYYGLFGFRDGWPLHVIDLDTGSKVYTYDNGTLNAENGYGVSMDSTRGIIYFHKYANNIVYEINLLTDFTPTTDGSKGTFNTSTNTYNSYTTATWGWSDNDGSVHVYLPHDTSHPLHDKLILFSRANSPDVRVANAGSRGSQATWSTYNSAFQKYGAGYDWSSNSIVYADRGMRVFADQSNGSASFAANGAQYNYSTPSSWTSGDTEDAFVRHDGDLIIASNDKRRFHRFPRV